MSNVAAYWTLDSANQAEIRKKATLTCNGCGESDPEITRCFRCEQWVCTGYSKVLNWFIPDVERGTARACRTVCYELAEDAHHNASVLPAQQQRSEEGQA